MIRDQPCFECVLKSSNLPVSYEMSITRLMNKGLGRYWPFYSVFLAMHNIRTI